MGTVYRCNITPNSVARDQILASPPLRFLPHLPGYLCYDGGVHEHGGQAPGREGREPFKCRLFSSLLLDSGVLCSDAARESQFMFKTIEK